ncbi:MAG: ParA family protein [Acidobacteria bacterium]|nr:ParA family protein [Acidobacteriota bacterium]
MKTIALVTQKGGTGKSTIAVHLAVAARRHGKVVAVIDIDPQGSAKLWAEKRGRDDLAVISARAAELPRLLEEARRQGADFVLIDTAGHMNVSSAAVIQSADIVLIPCRASLYDMDASAETAAQVRKAGGKQAAFVLNAVPSRGTRADEAREVLKAILPVSPVEVHNLVAFSDALNDGRSVEELDPHGKAAEEIRALYDWLMTL